MKGRPTIRDVLGEPESWPDHITDGEDGKPDMDGATILDVFVSGNQLAVYMRTAAGVELLSVFFIDNPELRAQIANHLTPGRDIHEAAAAPIQLARRPA